MEPRCSKSMVLLFLPCGILLLSLPLLFHIHKKGQSNSQPELRGIYSTIEEINGNGIYLNGISLKSLILGLGLFSGTEREAMHHTVLHLLEMLPAVSQKILQQRHIWYSFQTGKCIPSSPALNTNALLLSIYINSAWMQMPGSGCSCGSAAVTPFFFYLHCYLNIESTREAEMRAASWHLYLTALLHCVEQAAGDMWRPPRQRKDSACSESICHSKLCAAQPSGQVTGLQRHCSLQNKATQPAMAQWYSATTSWRVREGNDCPLQKGFLYGRWGQLAGVISDPFTWEAQRWWFRCSPHWLTLLHPIYAACMMGWSPFCFTPVLQPPRQRAKLPIYQCREAPPLSIHPISLRQQLEA